MDLHLSPEEETFRDEVRAFIRDNLPAEIQERVATGKRLTKDDFLTWHKILYKQGWVAPSWPKEYGGTGWTPMQRHLFDEELAAADTPPLMPFGLVMVGPVIMEFGSDEQKKKYLPRILSGEDWWCQGYSEPGSGSDLASLRTKAVREGDHYIVNGQKTWTTYAQYANLMFCLARTSDEGKPQEGISFLLVDMDQPGIEVKPIKTFDGGVEINDVFMTDVKVPVEDLVGEENKGWTYAKFLLGHERTSIAAVGRSRKWLERIKQIASSESADGQGSLMDDWSYRRKVAQAEIDLLALESVVLKALSAEAAGKRVGPEASLLKICGSELQQELTELMFEAVGWYSNPYVPEALDPGWNEEPIGPDYAAPLAPQYFNYRKTSIYGGTNEIQKGIIAKMVMGL